MDLLVTDKVWSYLSSHSSLHYMNMEWWKSSCYLTSVITHKESRDAVCCKSTLNFLIKLSNRNNVSGTDNVSNKLTAEQKAMSVFAKINYIQLNGPWRFNMWHFSLWYCLYSCIYKEKHHDAEHLYRKAQWCCLHIHTQRETLFTSLWLHFVHVYLL